MIALLGVLTGCTGSPATVLPTDHLSDTDLPVDTDVPQVDCTSACVDTSDEAGRQLCYSCRCRAAMDGWLPSPAELQCEHGAEIEVFTTDPSGELVPAAPGAGSCANPSLLYGTCDGGGRLGQLTHGDVTVKWICRYNHTTSAPGVEPYDDVGVILHNRRTGASCWFDDEDGTGIADGNLPDLDLEASDQANRDAFAELFYVTNGEGCTDCHDADPFLYTPYLQSVGWQTGPYVVAGFSRVTMDGGLAPVGRRALVSPESAPCRTCHRLADGASCAQWIPDSVGAEKGFGHEAAVLAAPGTDRWWLATWMPYTEGVPMTRDAALWETTYGAARDHVLGCCADPGAPGCVWEDVP